MQLEPGVGRLPLLFLLVYPGPNKWGLPGLEAVRFAAFGYHRKFLGAKRVEADPGEETHNQTQEQCSLQNLTSEGDAPSLSHQQQE